MVATNKEPAPAVYIEASPGICGGRPRVKGSRVKVSEIAWRHAHDDQSADEILEALPHLSLAQVHAALAYYYDHLDTIEAELRDEDEFVERMARRYAPHLVAE